MMEDLEYSDVKTKYKIIGNVGKGNFGSVKLGKHRETKEKFAVKVLKKSKMSEAEVAQA